MTECSKTQIRLTGLNYPCFWKDKYFQNVWPNNNLLMLGLIFEYVLLYLWCQILAKFDVNQISLWRMNWSQTIKQTHQKKNLFCGLTCWTILQTNHNILHLVFFFYIVFMFRTVEARACCVAFLLFLIVYNVWAPSWQNQQCGCAPSEDSDQHDASFLHADSEDSDQTWRMPRLIWVFAGFTVILLFFFMKWLVCHYQISLPLGVIRRLQFEPCHEKTCLQGFLIDKMQTEMLSWWD